MKRSEPSLKRLSKRSAHTRRGVVLLVVLTLLVLFVIVGLTFALVANVYRDTAERAARAADRGDDLVDELDRSMYLLLRGTETPNPFQRISILEDMYGDRPLKSAVAGLDGTYLASDILIMDLNAPSAAINDDKFSSCVLTITSGRAKGRSYRVVNSTSNAAATPQIRLFLTPTDLNNTQTSDADHVVNSHHPLVGDRVLLNRRAFSGVGAGYNPLTGNMDETGASLPTLAGGGTADPLADWLRASAINAAAQTPLAGDFVDAEQLRGVAPLVGLMPNYAAHTVGNLGTLGGSNEDWDAPDVQNMHISYLPPTNIAPTADMILPSYHRPALVRYWFHWIRANVLAFEDSSLTAQQQWNIFNDVRAEPGSAISVQTRQWILHLKRRIILRPLAEDHPGFDPATNPDAVNPQFTLAGFGAGFTPVTTGGTQLLPLRNALFRYDVDNDDDGRYESVLIDPLFPIKRTKDGRLYKTLIAPLVVDLGGRINLNAVDTVIPGVSGFFNNAPPARPATAPTALNRRGSGLGVGEISLDGVISNRAGLLGLRYGPDGAAGINDGTIPARDDLLSYMNNRGTPGLFAIPGSAYQSVPDYFGIRLTTVDVGGHPITDRAPMQTIETFNDPYEKRILKPNEHDDLFTAQDLEGVLRARDHDHLTQSKRIANLVANAQQRASITTHSTDVPIPPAASSLLMLNKRRNPMTGALLIDPVDSYVTIADMFRVQIAANNPSLTAAQLNNQVRIMVAPELLRGEPMDVNRPFGDMIDNNGNLVVDEFTELLAGLDRAYSIPPATAQVADAGLLTGSYTGTPIDIDNNDPLANNTPQQQYARHLFCLALLLTDGFDIPFDQITRRNGNGSGSSVAVTPGVASGLNRELTVRRLAQWAVNAADFRDPDSTMTAFEYDINPWDGWDVDGNPSTFENTATNQRRLVWGLEAPEAVITETAAWHDVRERDTDKDRSRNSGENGLDLASMPMGDDEEDQLAPPRGGMGIEVMCVRAPASPNTVVAAGDHTNNVAAYNAELPSAELYQYNGANRPALNMGQLSPIASADGVNYPVWRAAITHHHNNTPSGSAAFPVYDAVNSAEARIGAGHFIDDSRTHYSTNSAFDERPDNPTQIPFERFVWFAPGWTPTASGDTAIQRNSFANLRGTTPVGIEPGQYMVIGSRPIDPIGANAPMPANMPPESTSSQRMVFNGGFFQSFNNANQGTGGGQRINTRPVVGVVAERLRLQSPDPSNPAGANINWTNTATTYAGLSITEPLPTTAGLERVPQPNPGNGDVYPPDSYMDIYQATPVVYNANALLGTQPHMSHVYTDTPFRTATDPGSVNWDPLREYDMDNLTTYNNVRTVHLQRLADPLLAWNPLPGHSQHTPNLPLNPYITVDWSSVDCTVFSGESTSLQGQSTSYRFGSGQKGLNGAAVTGTMRAPWWPVTRSPAVTTANPGAIGQPYMTDNLVHTLGFLNEWGLSTNNPASDVGATRRAPATDAMGAAIFDPYMGYPVNVVFPWIKINNRPYASAYELMQVPCVGPAEIGKHYSLRTALSAHNALQIADNSFEPNFARPYGHLFNFHMGSDVTEAAPNQASLNLFRVFDFLHTPSPFVDTKKWINPAGALGLPSPLRLRPPYNRLLKFREPGKLNLNTMYPTFVDGAGNVRSHSWQALMHHFPEWSSDKFRKAMLSRQGYAGSFTDTINTPYLPTRFVNPFRSAMAGAHMPPLAFNGTAMQKSELEASMFRTQPQPVVTIGATASEVNRPLFHVESFGDRDVNRHAALAYEGIQRLDNLTTHRSNCYAVWITTAYFEVQPNQVPGIGNNVVDTGHLDGYQIMGELGQDTGEITRHRAFYIIDRSVPVGFEPGLNHNVDNTILLRRIIE